MSSSSNGDHATTMRSARVRAHSVAVRMGLVPDPPGEDLYHGFISYSHAADGKLAPALQKGLQQFAKPWYRTRALHIFRDDAALSANPQLWTSVQAALDSSQYFILLASPQAARSQWVTREVSYWREHKHPERILIGLTDGELPFARQNEQAPSRDDDALPEPLEGVFAEEPRYIDLRWARNAEDLAISHPRFRDAVAELAAPLHGKAKDEIASEEVRQRRRTVRVARAAAAAILTFLAIAIAAVIVAVIQRNHAVIEATIANSRQLAAVSETQLGTNLDVALALAARAYRTNANPQTRAALFQADLFSPHLVRFLPMGGQVAQVAGSSDGKVVVAGLANGRVMRWSSSMAAPAPAFTLRSAISSAAVDAKGDEIVAADGSKAVLWRSTQPAVTLQGPAGQDAAAVGISPSGKTVAVYYHVQNRVLNGAQTLALFDARGQPRAVHPLPPSRWAPTALVAPTDAALLLFDGTYGNWEWRRTADWRREDGSSASFGVHQAIPGYANDGSSITVTNGASAIPVWPTKGRSDPFHAPLTAEAPISTPTALALSPGSREAAVADSGTIYVARVAPAGSAHGSAVALGGNGSINTDALRFFAGGDHLLSASNDTVGIWNLAQLERLARTYRSPLDPSPCNACAGAEVVVSPDGRQMAAVDDRGAVVVQDLTGAHRAEVVNSSNGLPVWAAGGGQLLLALPTQSVQRPRVTSAFRSAPVVREWSTGNASSLVASGLTRDGRHVVVVDGRGDVRVEDPSTGRVVASFPGPRDLSGSPDALQPNRGEAAVDSSDGLVATVDRPNTLLTTWGSVAISDAATKRTVGFVGGGSIASIAFAGRRLLVQRTSGQLEVWNPRGSAVERVLPGDQSYVWPPVGSANGALVARRRADGSIKLGDLDTGATLATFPAPADPSLGLRLGVGFSPNGTELVETVQTIAGTTPLIIQRDISARALVAAACEAAGGTLTATEWRTFVGTSPPRNLGCA